MTGLEVMALIEAAVALAARIGPAIARLRQSGELTEEQERELDARIARLRDLPHWRVEKGAFGGGGDGGAVGG